MASQYRPIMWPVLLQPPTFPATAHPPLWSHISLAPTSVWALWVSSVFAASWRRFP